MLSFDDIFYKELEFEDLNFMAQQPFMYLLRRSFFRIKNNNPIGCSISDGRAFFESLADVTSQFGIYRENKIIPLALIRFGQVNNLFQSIDFTLLVISDDETDTICHSINELMHLLTRSSRVNKFYTMLSLMDKKEKHICMSLGFNLEVTFPKYVYYQGDYHDVSLYSLLVRDKY